MDFKDINITGVVMQILNFIKENFSLLSKKKANEILFQPAGELTLGVEIELQLIDTESFNLVPKADQLLKEASSNKKIKPEFYMSTVEINTDKCNNIQEVEKDLSDSIKSIISIGNKMDVLFATTGCHPFSRYADCIITPSPRYNELIDRNQWLTRRMTVYGLHVHIGMKSGDDCIRFNNFFMHFIPHLLAISASSPFWQGDDTGLASCRPTTYEALPTAGQPYKLQNWHEFETLYHTLKKCSAIKSLKDLWWDIRPSPGYGTLEIRVCDGLATLAETTAVTAFIHVLAHWFNDNASWIDQFPAPPRWLSRENKWRVMRHGLQAEMVVNIDGQTKPIAEDIKEWLLKTELYSHKLGYHKYMEIIKQILEKGNSTERQKLIFSKTNSLKDVVKYNTEEFLNMTPLWHNEAFMKKTAA